MTTGEVTVSASETTATCQEDHTRVMAPRGETLHYRDQQRDLACPLAPPRGPDPLRQQVLADVAHLPPITEAPYQGQVEERRGDTPGRRLMLPYILTGRTKESESVNEKENAKEIGSGSGSGSVIVTEREMPETPRPEDEKGRQTEGTEAVEDRPRW